MAIVITTFDGHALNAATSYSVELRNATAVLSHDVAVTTIARRNTSALLDTIAVNPVDFLLTITPANTSVAYATWKANVSQWFSPSNSDTTRVLAATLDGTAVQMDVLVVSRKNVRDTGVIGVGAIRYDVVVRALWPFWEATDNNTNAGSNITNLGNAIALPSVAFTSAVHKSRRITTVTGAGAAGGLVSYPVLFTLNDAAATTSNTFVFIEGVSVPTFFVNSGGAASKVWALVDTASDGNTQTHIDIVYGSALSNPLGGTLDIGGLDSSASTNTSWQWNNWRINQMPSRPGAWRPVVAGNHNSNAQISYGVTAESGSAVTFGIGTPGQYGGDADGMVLVVGAKAGTTNALSSLQMTLAYTTDASTISGTGVTGMDQATITAATVASPTVITTGAVHGLSAGDTVTITGSSGTTPNLDGTYTVRSSPAPTTHQFAISVNVTVSSSPSGLVTRGGTNAKPNPSLVHTSANHSFLPGDQVTLTGTTGYTPDINGNTYTVLASPAPTARTFAILETVTIIGGGASPTATKVHTSQAYARYRLAGSTTWLTAWTSNVAGTSPTSIDLDAAFEIIIGVENNGASADPCTLTVTSGGNVTLALDNTTTPTVSVAGATNMDFYNGSYQIGTGPTLTLDHLLVPDGTLTVDCKARTIVPQGNGPIYAGSGSPPITFTLSPYWLEVAPGVIAISNSTGGAYVATIKATNESS